ncbi:MAG: ATP-binding protein [Desulfobacterales bacterium]|nr:ATP-binding protein [Desulfobacterales bacterium]
MTTLIARAVEHRQPLLIPGAPGIGKTDLVYQAATIVDADVIISHPVVDDPVDYKGMPFVVNGKAMFLPFGNLNRAIEAKKPTIYFMDDLGQAPEAVQAAAMQLLLARTINGHAVSEHVTFIAATNRRQDKAGVRGILEPVKSRFTSIVELESDRSDWTDWALKNDVETPVIAFIQFRPELLHKFEATADLINSPCPRTVVNVSEVLKMGLPKNMEFEVITGTVGEAFATEFMAFLKIYRNLPNPDSVLMNPTTAMVPDDPSTQFALCLALAERATDANIERLAEYADRLPEEFSVLCVNSVVKRDPALSNTRAYLKWFNGHQEILC